MKKPLLYEIDIRNSKVYIDPSTIVLIQYNSFNDTLKLSFSGGSTQELANGKIVFDKLKELLEIIPLEVSIQ